MKTMEKNPIKTKGEMSLQSGMALTSNKIWNIKCILILIFYQHTQGIWGDRGRFCFLLGNLFSYWDQEWDEGQCDCLIFIV
jgi:hypothetical protein